MVKRLEDLSEIAQDILKTLKARRENALNIGDIRERIKKEVGESIPQKEIYKELSNLIKYGSVRSTEVKEPFSPLSKKREEKRYYLSRGIGSGKRNYNKLTGKATFADLGKYISRIFGSIFVLFGLGFLIYQNLPLSGAVISNNPIVKDINLVLPSILVVIGAVLIFLSISRKNQPYASL